jgi:hypothetical protein
MRTLIAVLLAALLSLLPGCDAVFVAGFVSTSTVTGTVSIVGLTVTDFGTQVTFVTLVQSTITHDFNFCGNVVNQFPIGSTVRVNFTPGTSCSSNLVVVILV